MKTSQKIVLALIGLLFALVLFSCDPAQRIARIVKRHPELVKTDTVWRKDTIYTDAVQKDSTFRFYQTDTVVMKKDKLTVKYYFNHDSTIYLQGKCDPDTVFKYYPVQVNNMEVAKALTWKQRAKLYFMDNLWWMLIVGWLIWKIFGKAISTLISVYFPWLNIFKK